MYSLITDCLLALNSKTSCLFKFPSLFLYMKSLSTSLFYGLLKVRILTICAPTAYKRPKNPPTSPRSMNVLYTVLSIKVTLRSTLKKIYSLVLRFEFAKSLEDMFSSSILIRSFSSSVTPWIPMSRLSSRPTSDFLIIISYR